jgi:hypothetical protein
MNSQVLLIGKRFLIGEWVIWLQWTSFYSARRWSCKHSL